MIGPTETYKVFDRLQMPVNRTSLKITFFKRTFNDPRMFSYTWDIKILIDVIGQFTVVCSVPWSLNRSEAGGDLVLLQTFLLLMCNKSWYSHANKPVNMIIYIWKARRFVTKQGHRQPLLFKGLGSVSRRVPVTFRARNQIFKSKYKE